MSGASPMRHLGGRFWWADRRYFTYPGLYVWLFKHNIRILPLPSRG